MSAPSRLCEFILLLTLVFDGAMAWNERIRRKDRHHRQVFSYPRDWDTDWKQWALKHRLERGDAVPDHDYTKGMTTKQIMPQEGRTMWVTRQKGSVVVPHQGATVMINPGPPQTQYKEVEKAAGTGRLKKKGHRKHKTKNLGSEHQWQYSMDQPVTHRSRPRPCVRCPGDRAVLATKGSNFVLMDKPPIIPCNPWSYTDKVKSEVVVGPKPGSKMVEGSHKMVLQLSRHKRTLNTCVIRYNVIVRKCSKLEPGPSVRIDCPQESSWGSSCNFSCEPGYILEGDSTTSCSDDLQWTGVQPHCILSTACPVPVTPENGHLSCRTPQHRPVPLQRTSLLPDGTVCHFRCQPGFTVPPGLEHLARMRCIAGSWDNDQDPVCIETNELEEEEEFPTNTSTDAVRLEGCAKDYCFNGGNCLTILDEPMCSCRPGYSGNRCEDGENVEEDKVSSSETEDNTIS